MRTQTPEQAIAQDARLSRYQRILLLTDGTVTQLLELLVAEPIHVLKLAQTVTDSGPDVVQAEPGQRVLRRTVLLRGGSSHYVYAHSCFVVERLPGEIQERLRSGSEPIGRV